MTVDPSLLQDLEARGLVHQIAEPHDAPLRELLATQQTVYCGFDPTSTSLHVGNLIPLLALRRFQQAGHRVIALAGGATGMVGDPSGKSAERNLLTREQLQQNLDGIKAQLRRFLDFDGPNAALLVDNLDWTADLRLLEFLRDTGKHFHVNVMIKKDSVRDRLEREGEGISFTEFSYMLLQALDFQHLFERHGCRIQVGGSDQYGNITAGTELIRRRLRGQAYGLTFPLLLKSDGSKFGKTAGGDAVWLDPARTSPFAFRQFWFNTGDELVITLLRRFTFLPLERIAELEAGLKERPQQAQRALAIEMTALVHGEETSLQVEKAAEVFFNPRGDLREMPPAMLEDAFAEAPTTELPRTRLEGEGISWWDLVVEVVYAGAQKRGAAKRDIESNAVALNGEKAADPERRVTAADLIHDRFLVLRKGKKQQFLAKVV
ncbi:MAG: tyrosine--tRNA ligase [Planctomycetota bacterium]